MGLARLLWLVQLAGLGSFGGGAELLKNAGKHRGHMGRKRHLGYRFSGDQHHRAGIHQGRSFLGAQADEVLVVEVGNAQSDYVIFALYRPTPRCARPPVFLKKASAVLLARRLSLARARMQKLGLAPAHQAWQGPMGTMHPARQLLD